MTRSRSALRDVTWICLGGLLAISVLAPQLADANSQVDRLQANERTLAHRCVIRPDGSVESCPAGTIHVDRVKAAAR